MTPLLSHSSFYLVGIKGVALTALAQCLLDAGKQVRGCDVAESFVTQPLLNERGIEIDVGFSGQLPQAVDCVIYTAAHQGRFNPVVTQARDQGLSTFSHAEALGELFNHKQGIAVCGVGGKSTTSAMISWILEKTGQRSSFAIGVGNIPGLGKTGQWSAEAKVFVAEADEYVTDPSAPSRGEEITPRFSYLKPWVTICTNLKFDHPDVYRDFEHTKQTYHQFFNQLKPGGVLITNASDSIEFDHQQLTFGESESADFRLINYVASEGRTTAQFVWQGKEYSLELVIPGQFNVMNALAALAACSVLGVDVAQGVEVLASFRSTMRRSEFIGEKNGIKYYDDYAHHPNEVKQVIAAFREWFPRQRLVVAFQSHTYSRTKSLFNDFVTAFEPADEVVMINIFASAREAFDSSVSSDQLCQAIQQQYPDLKAHNLYTLEKLAEYLQTSLKPGDVCLTVGAGDIYKVHSLIKVE